LRAGVLALFAASLAAPACADWTEYGGNTENNFVTTEKLTAPLGVLWKYATNVYADRGGNKGGAVIANGTAYFASKNRVYAVDAATGELRWANPSEVDPNDTSLPRASTTPVVRGEFLYVALSSGNTHRMTAFSTVDGSEIWSVVTGASVTSPPTLVADTLYFGADDDLVYAVDARTGALRWRCNDGRRDLTLSDDAVGSPVYYSGVIYINTADMKMWAFQADSGRYLWSSRVTAPSIGISPVAHGGRIYFAAGDALYQYRLRGGNFRQYRLKVENDISATPIITDTGWYVADRNGFMYAFTPDGKPMLNDREDQWKVKLEGRVQGGALLTADTVYAATDKGFVYGIDAAKGRITWTYRTEPPKGITPLYSYYPIRTPLAVSDGRLFVLGDDGTLTCMSADAPDDEGPIITTPKPARGAIMNGAPPVYFSVYMWDEGTGINPDTIEVLVDGVPVDPSKEAYNDRVPGQRKGWVYDPVRRQIKYETLRAERGEREQPLLDGRHRVQVQAADWRGNLNTLEWTFVVDNTLPRNAVAVRPTQATRTNTGAAPSQGAGGAGAPGSYPGAGGGMQGYGGMMGPGGPGGGPGFPGGQGQQGQFRGRFGGYQYQNRGRAGYGFGQQGGGFGGMGGGYGGRGGMGGGRGGYGGGRGGY
jgi:outer membrane protein assembly factor BamB